MVTLTLVTHRSLFLQMYWPDTTECLAMIRIFLLVLMSMAKRLLPVLKRVVRHHWHIVITFKDLHKKLLVAYSKFIRTTDAYHELTSQQL